MKIYYDKEVDTAYIQLSKKKPDGVIEISDFINVDTTEEGEIVGIEMLDASSKISVNTLFNFEIDYNSARRRLPDKPLKKQNKLKKYPKEKV